MQSTTDQYIMALQQQNEEKGRESSVMLQRIFVLQKQCQELRQNSSHQSQKQLYAKNMEIRMLKEGHEKWVNSLHRELEQFRKRYNLLKEGVGTDLSVSQKEVKQVKRQLEAITILLNTEQNYTRENIERLRNEFIERNRHFIEIHENRQKQHIGRLENEMQLIRQELYSRTNNPEQTSLFQQNQEMRRIIDLKNMEMGDMVQHLDRQYAQIQQLKAQLQMRSAKSPDIEKQSLLKQLIDTKYKLQESNNKLSQVRIQSEENAQLRRKVTELENRSQADKTRIENLTNELERLVEQSAASAQREQEIAKLRKQLADLKETNYQLKTSQVVPSDEVGRLTKIIADMERRMEDLQNAYYTLQEQLAKTRNNIVPYNPYEPIHQTIRELKTEINRYKLSGVQLYQSMEVTAPKIKPQTPIKVYEPPKEESNTKNPESAKKSREILNNIHEKLEAVRLQNASLKKSLVQMHRQVHHV